MPVAGNRYYNDPALGAAFSSLAQAFAPPSGSDMAGYAAAAAKKAEAQRLADLFASAQSPDFNQTAFDRMGQAAGAWTPATGYYGVDTAATTARRGQDITASTALTNNAADNARALEQTLIGDRTNRRGQDIGANTSLTNNAADNTRALATNAADNTRALEQTRLGNTKDITTALIAPVAKDATRFVPPSLADMYGVPATQTGVLGASEGERVVTPDGREIMGAPKQLSDEQVKGAILQQLPASDQRNAALSSVGVEQVIVNGKPEFVNRPEAAGLPAYNKPTADSSTEITRLITERDSLPPGDPNRAAYDQRIQALGRGQQQSAYDRADDESNQKLNETLFENATKSLADRDTYKTILAAVDNPSVDQGTLAGAQLQLRKSLNAFGVDAGDTSPAEMLNALGAQLSLRLRDPSSGAGMPGAMSDADRQFLQSMSVSLGNSPNANRMLAQYFMAVQQRNIDLNDLREQYVSKNGRINEGFKPVMADYLKNNDPTAAIQQRLGGGGAPAAPAPAPTGAPDAPQPGAVMDGFRFKGGNPGDPNAWEPAQ